MLFKNVAARSVLIVRCHGIPADNLVPDAEKTRIPMLVYVFFPYFCRCKIRTKR